MVHLGALPGSPLYNKESGITGLIKEAKKDLEALQTAKFDAIMFGNENDRPYELKVDSLKWLLEVLKKVCLVGFSTHFTSKVVTMGF